MQTLFELISQRKEVVKKGANERADLLRFFIENIPDKNGKQYKPAYMGMRLSHIPTKDLYYMISIFRDTEKRRGVIGARKEFWFSIKSKQ